MSNLPPPFRRGHALGTYFLAGFLVLFLVLPGKTQAAETPQSPTSIAEAIRIRLESGGWSQRFRLGKEPVLASQALFDFYLNRFFEPAWLVGKGPGGNIAEFLAVLNRIDEEGLEPGHYHLETLNRYLEKLSEESADVDLLADLDLLLTDAFLVLATHLQSGRIDPETIDPEWQVRRAEYDPFPALAQALATGEVQEVLHAQLPASSEYANLRQALETYRAIRENGGWPQLPASLKLRPGDQGPLVSILRSRLEISGDYTPGPDPLQEDFYGPDLVGAVEKFQLRHGLDPDGIVGKNTLAALNATAAERVRQIEVNLERWRWLPRDLGDRYLLVNIAAFELYLVENGSQAMKMRVVVGKPYRRTPVFSGLITYLVFNPSWNVPQRIATEDLLPQIRKDPGLFNRLGIRVFRGWGAEAREVDPADVNWALVTKSRFPFNLRQEPGPANALGRVKFMFPNKYDVYLHDTPSRELFRKETRTFSSGCIRLEKPLDLAQNLLQGTPLDPPGALEKFLTVEKPRSVMLARPIPVHLLYWTAWVDSGGGLNFRPDVYDRDRPLGQALAIGPPGH